METFTRGFFFGSPRSQILSAGEGAVIGAMDLPGVSQWHDGMELLLIFILGMTLAIYMAIKLDTNFMDTNHVA